jgi:hypothetical protein
VVSTVSPGFPQAKAIIEAATNKPICLVIFIVISVLDWLLHLMYRHVKPGRNQKVQSSSIFFTFEKKNHGFVDGCAGEIP